MKNKYVIGSRGSELALMQSNWVKHSLEVKYPHLSFEIKKIQTMGDTQLESIQELSESLPKGLFTKQIDQALLDGEIDLAVHSYKDIPVADNPGISTSAIPIRESVEDVLITFSGKNIHDLNAGSIIGTSSPRRIAQAKLLNPDLIYEPIRGNVPTRIQKVKEGVYDGIIIAKAGLKRLHLDYHITETFSVDDMLPAAGQGALGIQTRDKDLEMIDLLKVLHHEKDALCVDLEKKVLEKLGGGCQVPIGVYAQNNCDKILLVVGVFSMCRQRYVKKMVEGTIQEADFLVQNAVDQLMASEALEILAEINL